MDREDFINLINEIFDDCDFEKLYAIRLMKNDSIKIEYQPPFFTNCKCTGTLRRKKQD